MYFCDFIPQSISPLIQSVSLQKKRTLLHKSHGQALMEVSADVCVCTV